MSESILILKSDGKFELLKSDDSGRLQSAIVGMGEVQATPSANTLLARVKAIETELVAIKNVNGIKKITDPVGLKTQSATEYESLAVEGTIKSLTADTYGDAVSALITVETKPMRYRIDGGDPTAAEGHLVDDGDSIELASASDIANFKAIRTTGDSATIKVTYYE